RHGASAARVTFLHPLALVGLAAAAIPALLHLLERRVPPEAEFPPLRYLSEAERQNARRLKLRHLLLLILRTALIVLIVVAAARPPAREVHGVSDLQRTALGPGRAGVPRGVRVLALAPPPASQAPANRGVGAARVTDGAAAVSIVGTPGTGAAGGAAPVTL